MAWKVVVDKNKCIGCEACKDTCPSDVYEMVDDKASPVREDDCVGCEACVEACPEEAITVTEI